MLEKSSPWSASGPDTIPYSVWKQLHRLYPDIIPALIDPLVQREYHPATLKRAEGIVLDEPGKPSYDTLTAYRVMVLRETLSLVVERIIANRLAAQARELGLLHPNQCGFLPGISSFHAAVSLTHEVAIPQRLKLKESSLFLDIKGGLDNIKPGLHTGLLRERGVSPHILSWIRPFLSRRTCHLKFQVSPEGFTRVAVGTPQGSPISPLLFVLYVASLHKSLGKHNTFSLVDDFALTSTSLSHRRNIQILQSRFRTLLYRAKRLGLSFSVPKTELIYWRTPKDRSSRCLTPIHLDLAIFHPKEEVQWLGYWFSPSIATTAHFNRSLALAQGAFAIVKKLAPPGAGLTTPQTRYLIHSLLLLVISYGADLFVPNGSMAHHLDVFWHKALRWATNCFSSTRS